MLGLITSFSLISCLSFFSFFFPQFSVAYYHKPPVLLLLNTIQFSPTHCDQLRENTHEFYPAECLVSLAGVKIVLKKKQCSVKTFQEKYN